jgi:hypothetical protein
MRKPALSLPLLASLMLSGCPDATTESGPEVPGVSSPDEGLVQAPDTGSGGEDAPQAPGPDLDSGDTVSTEDASATPPDVATADVSDPASAACAPGEKRCNGNSSELCQDTGTWQLASDCASQGLACNNGSCVPACSRDPKTRNNAGCEYWAVDLDNNGAAADAPYAVIVSNLGTLRSTVRVTRRDSASAAPAEVLTREVAPGTLEVLSLPSRNMGTSGLHWAGYRIEATAPVVAYQFNPLENVAVYSNDASLLLPVDTFATEFIVMSREQIPASPPFRGTFSVVAAGAATDVTITPTTRTLQGGGLPALSAGQSHTVTLEPYQVLNVKSDQTEGDLTGTIVTSTRPVGVFGGHEGGLSASMQVARERQLCCVDHLEHQLYPVSTWGTRYIAARTNPRGLAPDYWRVVAAEDGTQVTFEPASVRAPVTLNRGKFIDFPSTLDFVINSDKPVMVGQVLASSAEILNRAPGATCVTTDDCDDTYTCKYAQRTSGAYDFMCTSPTCTTAGSTSECPASHVCACQPGKPCSCQALGDPTLILVPPVSQYRSSYVFLSPNKYAFDFINIVAPVDAIVTLDGQAMPPANFISIGPDWKAARMAVQDGVHTVTADKPVGVIAYGYDDDVSYGYAAGLNLVDREP